jgi:hypothetical protein
MLDSKLLSDHAPVELELWGARASATAAARRRGARPGAPATACAGRRGACGASADAPKTEDDRWETGDPLGDRRGRWEERVAESGRVGGRAQAELACDRLECATTFAMCSSSSARASSAPA